MCDEVEEDLSCFRMKICTAAIFCNVSGGLSDGLKCQTTKPSQEDALKGIRWQFRVLPSFFILSSTYAEEKKRCLNDAMNCKTAFYLLESFSYFVLVYLNVFLLYSDWFKAVIFKV